MSRSPFLTIIVLFICSAELLGQTKIWSHAPAILGKVEHLLVTVEDASDPGWATKEAHVLSTSGLIIHREGVIAIATANFRVDVVPRKELNIRVRFHTRKTANGEDYVDSERTVSAKVLVHKSKYGISLLKLKSKEAWEVASCSNFEPKLGSELLAIDRSSRSLYWAAQPTRLLLSTSFTKPFTAFFQQGLSEVHVGAGVFDSDGRLFGMSTTSQLPKLLRSGATSDSPRPRVVVVPIKKILELLPKSMQEKPKAKQKTPVDSEFKKADTDKSGDVSQKEFTAYASRRLGDRGDAFFTRFFKAVDKDKSGAISPAELSKRLDAMRAMRSQGGNRSGRRGRRNREEPPERDLKNKEGDYDKVARRAAPRDAFPVFDKPEMDTSETTKIKPTDPVIGVYLGGEARAYPIATMGKHELGNDVCGKTPIAVSW